MATNPSVTSIGLNLVDGAVAQSLIRDSPNCVKVLDQDGRVQFMSENGLCAMEIDDFETIRGRFWWDLWPTEASATLESSVRAAKGGVATEFEAACPTAKGTPKWWRVRVSRIEGGRLGGMVLASSEDVTAHRAAIARNSRYSRENEALRQFTRFVAHDLKNPIRRVRVLAELVSEELEAKGVEADDFRTPGMLRESADTLMRLLAGLEDLRAVDDDPLTGRTSMAKVQSDVLACLPSEMLSDLRTRWTGDCESYVAISHGLLVMALKNLIENAWKYGRDESGVHVEVNTAVQGGVLRIVVCDSGPGFPKDADDSVFDSFRRLGNANGIAGTGTGLAIVDQVAKRYSGRATLVRDADEVARGVMLELSEFT